MSKYWHITWVTNNSRISERMVKYRVKRGEPVLFDEFAERSVTKIISEIVHEYNYKIFAYNICKDHIHIIIESEQEKLPDIVKTLKSISALRYKDIAGIPRDESFHLWAQKYNKWLIESDEQFRNTAMYIIYNREKHHLPENKGLKPLVLKIIESSGDISHIKEYMSEMERV